MGNPSNFHQILNVPENSSLEEIRSAYKRLSKKWHPDKYPSSSKAEAEAKFKSITEAYEALRDEFKNSNPKKPEKKKDDPLHKYASTPLRNFKKFFNKRGASTFFHDLIFPNKTRNHGSAPGKEFKDFHYSRDTTAAASNSPLRRKAFSGQIRRKPPPDERNLECTLEELWRGCIKEVKFVRDVVTKNGAIVEKEEVVTIKVNPGWKKGTKITFEGLGDERPGCLPADVIFFIAEKEHPLFKRVGHDLILEIDVPLANALTGYTFSFQLLNGEAITFDSKDEVIYPGYEKVIEGKGMPFANDKGKTGDLRIKFNIVFPEKLSLEQRKDLVQILNDT